jgi:hypothetical protein
MGVSFVCMSLRVLLAATFQLYAGSAAIITLYGVRFMLFRSSVFVCHGMVQQAE